MEMRIQHICEELYWETAQKAVEECKLVALGALRLCRNIFRGNEEEKLEKRYGYLFAPYGEGDVGEKILDRMVAISIPAYGNDLKAIEEMLDDPYHAELNAHYYFQTGQVLAENYKFPVFNWGEYHQLRDLNSASAIAMWGRYEEKKREVFLSIAESLWNFDWFAEQYQGLVSAEQIQEYQTYCKKSFIEERIFLQPEWLLFSCERWDGVEDFLYNNLCTEFFLQTHREHFALLPADVLKSKKCREALSKKYKIKRI